jgi:tetratricopeptide (TPR) repeat protein
LNNRLFRVALGVVALVLGLVAVSLYFSQRYLEKEQQLAATGQFEEALQKAKLAGQLNPFSPEPLNAQSYVLRQQGRNGAAARALKEATRQAPADYEPYLFLGDLQSTGLNRPEAAVESYRKALERNPREEVLARRLAEALFRAGELEKAAGRYEKLRRGEDIQAEGMYDLGRIYVQTSRPEKGLKALRAAEERTEERLGNVEGQPREQAQELKSSIELAIAEAYVVQRRYGEARRVLANSSSEQAPAILEFLNSDPQGYRQSVLENEIYR